MSKYRMSNRVVAAALAIALAMTGTGAAAAPGGTIAWAGASTARGGSFLSAPSRGLIDRPAQGGWFGGTTRAPMIGPYTPRRAPQITQTYRSAPVTDLRLAALITNPPRDFRGLGALGCIAVSIYHEARNQPPAGQYAVGSVILTRAANPERWGNTACDVVQPIQFSYLTPDRQFAPIREGQAWQTAVEIAAQVLQDGPAPALKGADHYHATYVWPTWNQHMDSVGRIADHVFWRSRPKPGKP